MISVQLQKILVPLTRIWADVRPALIMSAQLHLLRPMTLPRNAICGGALQLTLGIRNECTLCKVEREGLTSGFAIVMVARHRRIRALSIDVRITSRLKRSETWVSLLSQED